MKKIILPAVRLFLAAVLLLSMVVVPARSETPLSQNASSVNAGISTVDIYNKMIALFLIGEKTESFDAAMEVYETYNSSLQSYHDAEKYYRYMQARKYLIEESFANAAVIFQSLEDFRGDSALYAAYASGRIAEMEGRFGDAVSYYIIAADLNKNTGTGSDVVERMLQCNSRISDEQKNAQYKAALADFEAAKNSGDAVRIAEVLKAFTALAGYQDADMCAEICENYLKMLTRKIAITAGTSATSVFISWTDTAEAAEKEKSGDIRYNVLWKPVNCRQTAFQANSKSPVTLTGLIPGTDYEITVQDADSESVGTTVTVSIPAPQIYPRDKITFNRLEIAGINPITLDLEYPGADGGMKRITPLEVFQMWDTFLIRQPENGFTASDLNNCVLYGGVVFTNRTGEEMDVGLQAVLRSSTLGTYQTETENWHLQAETQPQMACVNINEALMKLQDEYFTLAVGQYMIEIYMDGQFLCSGSFVIR